MNGRMNGVNENALFCPERSRRSRCSPCAWVRLFIPFIAFTPFTLFIVFIAFIVQEVAGWCLDDAPGLAQLLQEAPDGRVLAFDLGGDVLRLDWPQVSDAVHNRLLLLGVCYLVRFAHH